MLDFVGIIWCLKFMHNKGFTLIELLVAIAVIGILLAGSFASVGSLRDTYSLLSAADTVKMTLEKSRLSSLAREDGAGYGVKLNETSILLFKGSSYNPNDPNNKTIGLPTGTKISSINLDSGAASDAVVFGNLTGTTTPGTIILSLINDSSKTRTIYISGSGKISSLPGTISVGGGGGGSTPVGSGNLNFDMGWSIQTTSELKFRFLTDPQYEQVFIMQPHFNGDKSVFNYVGYFGVGGVSQKISMYSNHLDPNNTILSIIREPEGVAVPLEVSIDDRVIVTYLSDGTAVAGSFGGTMTVQ